MIMGFGSRSIPLYAQASIVRPHLRSRTDRPLARAGANVNGVIGRVVMTNTHEYGHTNDTIRVNCGCNLSSFLKVLWEGFLLLGCHIGVTNRIFGGSSGNSDGKVNRALKKPPSLETRSASISWIA